MAYDLLDERARTDGASVGRLRRKLSVRFRINWASTHNLRRWLESRPQGRLWEEGVAKHYVCIGGSVYGETGTSMGLELSRAPDYLELFGSATHGVLAPGPGRIRADNSVGTLRDR